MNSVSPSPVRERGNSSVFDNKADLNSQMTNVNDVRAAYKRKIKDEISMKIEDLNSVQKENWQFKRV